MIEINIDTMEQIENQNDNAYILDVDLAHKTYIGKEFDTLEQVYSFYNMYAKEAGFNVRSHSTKKHKESNEIIRKEYVCSKEGTMRDVEKERTKRRGKTHEGCKTKLVVVMIEAKTFVVRLFFESHNHSLTTLCRVHLLRSHQRVFEAQKCLSQQFSIVNIPTHQRMDIFELQAGDLDSVGCTQKDLNNFERDLRNKLRG